MRQILRPGAVFVDIGANTGVLTMLGAALVESVGQVYAIEASIENAALILANVRNLQITNTVILPIAVSDKKGIEFISVDYGGSNKLVRTEAVDSKNYRFEPVATDTLDSLLSHLPRVDLIKIDIEGREGSAFRGAWNLIARTRPQIIGEYHLHSPEPWYADELVAKGYNMAGLTREGGVIELGRDIGLLKDTAAKQLIEHGVIRHGIRTPFLG
jgi:FkbM family methyltransferase